MFQTVICIVATGEVQRTTHDTWEAARAFMDDCTGEHGRKIRAFVERAESPAPRPVIATMGRSAAA